MHASLQDRWNAVSLRTKITGVTVLMLMIGLLVSGVGTMTMLKPYLISQVDARLKTVAQSASLDNYFKVQTDDASGTTLSPRTGASDYFMIVFDADGKPLLRNWTDKPTDELPVLPSNVTFDLNTVTRKGGHVFTLYDGHRTEFHAVATLIPLDKQGTWGTALFAVSLQQTNNLLAIYLTIFLCFGVGVVVLGGMLTRLLVTSTFGPLREVERTAAAIADGDFSQRLGGATPNTEVGRLNRSLNTMLNRIDRAFRDRARTIEQMRRFVGDASHELRTPLVSVRGYAELYRMGALQKPEDVGQAMERIEKEAIRMTALVEDLLELARLDETKPLDLTPIDLVPIAQDAALDAMASAPERTVTVLTPPAIPAPPAPPEEDASPGPQEGTATAPPTGPIAFAGATFARLRGRRRRPHEADTGEVPTSAAVPAEAEGEPALVLAEENKIRQVVTNLMGNAMRFTAEDAPLELRVQVDHGTRRAMLDVIDHGEGIPEPIREKIFQRFWRADTSRTRETGGSGLGLSIVASIIAAHGGTVEALETEGGGATFRLSLPLFDEARAAAREADAGSTDEGREDALDDEQD